jgi:hypothetical protein
MWSSSPIYRGKPKQISLNSTLLPTQHKTSTMPFVSKVTIWKERVVVIEPVTVQEAALAG